MNIGRLDIFVFKFKFNFDILVLLILDNLLVSYHKKNYCCVTVDYSSSCCAQIGIHTKYHWLLKIQNIKIK